VSSHPVKQVPRPVADIALQSMLARTDEIAKTWAISLIAQLPLQQAGEIPFALLASEAPEMCALALRALSSDEELGRLADSGEGAILAGRLGKLAGARDLRAAVAAVESLRAVLWEELTGALERPSVRQVSELADRLSYIGSLITIAVLTHDPGAEHARGSAPPEPPAPATDLSGPQIEIHDTRREGPAAWIRSIGSSLEQHARDGQPFVVALIEVAGIERLRHSEDPAELGRMVGEVQDALRTELRPADVLTRDSDGRYWLVARETEGSVAMMLAERLIATVRERVTHRGAPVEVAIGVAVCPEDGHEASELAAHADMKLFAARAAGLSLAPLGDLDISA
jgi:GGDEF domain-containing protein